MLRGPIRECPLRDLWLLQTNVYYDCTAYCCPAAVLLSCCCPALATLVRNVNLTITYYTFIRPNIQPCSKKYNRHMCRKSSATVSAEQVRVISIAQQHLSISGDFVNVLFNITSSRTCLQYLIGAYIAANHVHWIYLQLINIK